MHPLLWLFKKKRKRKKRANFGTFLELPSYQIGKGMVSQYPGPFAFCCKVNQSISLTGIVG